MSQGDQKPPPTSGPEPCRAFRPGPSVFDGTGQRLRVRLPTSRWRSGVPVLDAHTLELPPDLAAGTYAVWIGWYELQTGERLPLPGGADSLLLTEVQVR